MRIDVETLANLLDGLEKDLYVSIQFYSDLGDGGFLDKQIKNIDPIEIQGDCYLQRIYKKRGQKETDIYNEETAWHDTEFVESICSRDSEW